MISDFLVVEFLGNFYDIKALIFWGLFGFVYYYSFESEPKNINLLIELNKKIDLILEKTK